MILLYRGVSLVSRAIRWQTRSEYSHAAWMLPDGSVIEAWRSGVRHVPSPFVNHSPGTEIDVYAVDGLTSRQARDVRDFLLAQVGRGYDWLSVLRFVSRREGASSRWFCSELVHAALAEAGVELLRGPSWQFAPGHLAWSPLVSRVHVELSEDCWRALYCGMRMADGEGEFHDKDHGDEVGEALA